MTVTASQVKDLRERTGAGMMDAKNALVEAGGDMEKAMEILRQRGIATAEKKSGRVTAEGQVKALIDHHGKVGVLVEVNCETDFVAKGDAFSVFAADVAAQIASHKVDGVDALLAEKSLHTEGSVQDYVVEKIGQIKENLTIRRFTRYELHGEGLITSYIHTGGKIGVLLEIGVDRPSTLTAEPFTQFARDVAMQIASAAPEFVGREDIPGSVIEEETRIELGKEDIQNKPEDIRKKIVAGRVDKLLAHRVLLEQPFVKDPGKTIKELVQEVSSQVRDVITIRRFTRYVLGEGIEKNQSNFAEEVMAQLK